MKSHILFFLLLLFITGNIYAQDDVYRLFKVEDFTKESIFTKGIEGPNVDRAGNLFIVNFQKEGTIGYVNERGEASVFLTLPAGSVANSIQFDKHGDMLLADYTGHNILKVKMKSRKVKVYSHAAFNQPNDICINKQGQLFASDPNWKESTGKIWRIDKGGNAKVLNDQMGTTNCIDLSPDEKTLYVNESVQRKIWAFDVDAKGNISNTRLFAEFPDFGFDGMKCDKEGNLYAARYGKGVIVVLSPDGKIIREVQLKGKDCTNLVFGGLNGKLVYVTMQDRMGVEMFRNDIAGKRFANNN